MVKKVCDAIDGPNNGLPCGLKFTVVTIGLSYEPATLLFPAAICIGCENEPEVGSDIGDVALFDVIVESEWR